MMPTASEYPHIEEVADVGRLAEVVQQHMDARFTSDSLRVDGCRIERVYYKPMPRGHCRIRFKADILSRDHLRVGEQLFFAHLFPANAVQAKYVEAMAAARVEPAFGLPVTLIPQWNMILWAFPNDPRLVGLPTLSSPGELLATMRRCPEKVGLGKDRLPVALDSEMVKYVPGKRCGYIFRLQLAGNTAPDHVVYAKAYGGENGQSTFNAMQQLWASEAHRAGKLHLPEPYGYDADLRVLWQEALPDRPLSKKFTTVDLPAVVAQAARALAALHGTEMDRPRRVDTNSELVNVARCVAQARQVMPGVAERCAALYQRLEACAADLGPAPAALVHGSFKFSHIYAEPGEITVIDFDGLMMGDPAYDLGRFCAHIQGLVARAKLNPGAAERTIASFCETYNESAAVPLTQRRINWFITSLIVSSHVFKTIKRLRPDESDELLTIAERICPG